MRNTRSISAALLSAAGLILALPAAPVSAANITISADGCSSWTFANNILTCQTGSTNPTPSGAPTSCSVNPPNASLSAAGAVNFTASCAGTAATSWSWTVGGAAQQPSSNGASSTIAANISQSTTVVATPSNASGSGSPISVTVAVNTTPPPGGNVPGPASCSGYSTKTLPLNWNTVGVVTGYSATVSGFNGGDALVVQFTTGSQTSTRLGTISVAEFQGGVITRTATLSESPCDFGTGLYGPVVANTFQIPFSVGPNAYGYPALQPNKTYYLNVKNEDHGVNTCAGGTCNVIVSIGKPRGL